MVWATIAALSITGGAAWMAFRGLQVEPIYPDRQIAIYRGEFDRLTEHWNGRHRGSPVSGMAWDAISEWRAAPSDRPLLYRAMALHLAATSIDPSYKAPPWRPSLASLPGAVRDAGNCPWPEFRRMRFIYLVSITDIGLDNLAEEMLARFPDDRWVARAYIRNEFHFVGTSKQTSKKVVELGDRLVAEEPERPANWSAKAIAYWVRSCTPGSDSYADVLVVRDCTTKLESMLPADERASQSFTLWKRGIAAVLSHPRRKTGRNHRQTAHAKRQFLNRWDKRHVSLFRQ